MKQKFLTEKILKLKRELEIIRKKMSMTKKDFEKAESVNQNSKEWFAKKLQNLEQDEEKCLSDIERLEIKCQSSLKKLEKTA